LKDLHHNKPARTKNTSKRVAVTNVLVILKTRLVRGMLRNLERLKVET
jgi:hypothetical protein